MKLFLAALSLGIAISSPANAQLLNFDFTISGSLYSGVSGTGLVGPATVEGEILGLQDNMSDQSPTDIIITSAPVQLGLAITSNGYSLANNGWVFNVNGTFASGFTVLNDEIDSSQSSFLATVSNSSEFGTFGLNADAGTPNYNVLGYQASGQIGGYVASYGTNNVTYSETATPEPSTYALLLGGLGLLTLLRLRAKRA